MNKLLIKRYQCIFFLCVAIAGMSGCKKDFLERPPTDAIVDANFYKTDQQVLSATFASRVCGRARHHSAPGFRVLNRSPDRG